MPLIPVSSRLLSVAAASWLGVCTVAHAQNHSSVPLGGRTATMGGAAVAAGNDSAMPYLNPAGLAGVPGDIFGVSATVYGWGSTTYDGAFFPGSTPSQWGSVEIEQETLQAHSVFELPSSVMYFRQLSAPDDATQHRLGMSLVIPIATKRELLGNMRARFPTTPLGPIDTRESLTDTASNTTYLIGPGYALGLSDRVHLGLSAFLVYSRYVQSHSDSFLLLAPGAPMAVDSTTSVQQDSYGVLPVAGLQVRVFDHLWIGAAGAPPSIWLAGRRDATHTGSQSAVDLEGNGTTTRTTVQHEADASFHRPWRLSTGVAYDDREGFSAAFDVSVYGGQSDAAVLDWTEYRTQTQTGEAARTYTSRGKTRQRNRAVFNVAMGAEWAFSRQFSIRGGAFTDSSPYDDIGTTADDADTQRIDNYGATLGLGVRFGSFDSTFGVVGMYGTGKYGAANTFGVGSDDPRRTIPIDVTSRTLMLVLSGAVTLEEAKQTMQDTLGMAYLPELPGADAASVEGWQPPPWGPVDLPGEGYRPSERPDPGTKVMVPVEPPSAPAHSQPPAPQTPALQAPVSQTPAQQARCLRPGQLDGVIFALNAGQFDQSREGLDALVPRCRSGGQSSELVQVLFLLGVALAGNQDMAGARAAWGEALRTTPSLDWDERLGSVALRQAFQLMKAESPVAPGSSTLSTGNPGGSR